jgi:dTMP kinase
MFITFEGIEGCGKTTQVHRLAAALQSSGRRLVKTREPGGSPVGRQIRRILLAEGYSLSPYAELLLYGAERAEHVDKIIKPALARGEWVLCDRYGDATRAYQAFGRGLPREDVEAVHAMATGGLEPDLTFYLRVPVEMALSRARRRNEGDPKGEGRFEAEALAFHERVACGYESLAAEFCQRVEPVDATGAEEKVAARIHSALERRLGG